VFALWDSPRQREAYEWLTRELPNLRIAFRWAADRDDLDTAAPIALYAALIGFCNDQFEPLAWVEDLLESARATAHPRLVQLYVMAAQCYAVGRVDVAIGYVEAAEQAILSGRFDDVPFDIEATLSAPYNLLGRPDQSAALLRRVIARRTGAQTIPRACLAMALGSAGADDDAREAAEGLLDAAETTDNPNVKALALLGYSWAHRESKPDVAYTVGRRALTIAQDSGNRYVQSTIAIGLARLAVARNDVEALDFLTLTIRDYQDGGSFILMGGPLGILATYLHRLGRDEPAATLLGFADMPPELLPFREVIDAIAEMRGLLGNETYEARSRMGKRMTAAAMATYALEQIDLARISVRNGSP
jgi:tetratricopeptide (TPR) repeat protein